MGFERRLSKTFQSKEIYYQVELIAMCIYHIPEREDGKTLKDFSI